ncbi:MAG: DUF3275 family protein [Betaproteobacteria bacterium]|nr:DUF3275 family protein [Betaproteobacteria bacterium]
MFHIRPDGEAHSREGGASPSEGIPVVQGVHHDSSAWHAQYQTRSRIARRLCRGRPRHRRGRVRIKDPLLDQFEEGKYQGRFLISNISPSSYFFGGKVVIEVRAWLADIFLDQADEGPAESTPVEPDPVDEPVVVGLAVRAPVASSSAPSEPVALPPIELECVTDAEKQDYELLGIELFPVFAARAPIRLLPEVGREQFTRQRLRLKEVGYTFDPLTKSWQCPSTAGTVQ